LFTKFQFVYGRHQKLWGGEKIEIAAWRDAIRKKRDFPWQKLTDPFRKGQKKRIWVKKS